MLVGGGRLVSSVSRLQQALLLGDLHLSERRVRAAVALATKSTMDNSAKTNVSRIDMSTPPLKSSDLTGDR